MGINDKVVSVIGCGNLGSALTKGLLRQGHPPDKIIATRRNKDELRGFEAAGVRISDDNLLAIKNSDVIILAARPSQIGGLLSVLSEEINQRAVPVASVVAGLGLKTLAAKLKVKIIRSMPNIASAEGEGVTIYQLSEGDEELNKLAQDLFSPLGLVVRVDKEEDIDTLTAVSGCGPAYFFYFIKVLCDYAKEQGIKKDDMARIGFQIMKGATVLLDKSELGVKELIDSVAVPGEKTATRRALDFMQEQGIEEIIKGGCAQARMRAVEMGKETEETINES